MERRIRKRKQRKKDQTYNKQKEKQEKTKNGMNLADEVVTQKKALFTYNHHDRRYRRRYCNLGRCILLDQRLLAQSYCCVHLTQGFACCSFCFGQEVLDRYHRSGMDRCSYCLDLGLPQGGFLVALETG